MVPVISDPRAMRARAAEARRAGQRIAFVPTMGYLHAGHVSLLEAGRARGDLLVLSIFVNPTQFGPSEDLSRYPRDLGGDLARAAAAGVDVAFVPGEADMYPERPLTFIEVRELTDGMCGARRPGHFAGVATVVTKLFNIVQPHLALFGEKDFQQLAVIRKMTKDLDLDVEIVGMPIVREPDGLAMSSRNAYLSPAERRDALVLSRALGVAEEVVASGQRAAAEILLQAAGQLMRVPAVRVDYLELRDAETLQTVEWLERPAVLAVAAFVGKTRLIDNRVLRP